MIWLIVMFLVLLDGVAGALRHWAAVELARQERERAA